MVSVPVVRATLSSVTLRYCKHGSFIMVWTPIKGAALFYQWRPVAIGQRGYDLVPCCLKGPAVRELPYPLDLSGSFTSLGGRLFFQIYSVGNAFHVLRGREHHVDHIVQSRVLARNEQTAYLSTGFRSLGILLQLDQFDQCIGADQPHIPSVPRAAYLRF